MKKWQRIDDGLQITKVGFRSVVHKAFIMIAQFTENAKLAKMTDVQAVFLPYGKLKELEGTI